MVLIILLLLFGCRGKNEQTQVRAVRGVFDLSRQVALGSDIVDLKGEWQFYWQRFLLSGQFHQSTGRLVKITTPWDKYPGKYSKKGYATYRLQILPPQHGFPAELAIRIRDINTSYHFYANGKKIGSNGHPSHIANQTMASSQQKIFTISVVRHQPLELILQIANYHHNRPGMLKAIQIGRKEVVYHDQKKSIALELFLFGALIIMGFYHLGLFWLRRRDKSPLYFGIICLLTGYRTLTLGNKFIYEILPDLGYSLGGKLEYLTFYLSLPIFLNYLYELYCAEFHKRVIAFVYLVSITMSLSVVLLSTFNFTKTLVPMQMLTGLVIIYTIYNLIRSVYHKRETARTFLFFFILLALTIINDILLNNRMIETINLSSFGLFLFIFGQAFLLSIRFSRAFRAEEILTDHLTRTNEAYSRFVPREFLSYLNKKSILEVELGDQVEREMTILFCDIRSFTELSETLSPEENFNFLNSYLKRMAPIISSHQGFIDKFIGDAIMALFPNHPEDAIRAAIEIQDKLVEYNQHRDKFGYRHIDLGIGIHTGKMMLGTIGIDNRMESTVISDAVNLASRLEGLTKIYQSKIIISKDTYERMTDCKDIVFRQLDIVQVKGKRKQVAIFELVR